jgi:hypothetical protein
MAKTARLVLHHAGRLGILLVSCALFSAFLVGWALGTILQLLSAMMPRKGGRDDHVRLRMAQDYAKSIRYYDDVLLHGRVT